MSSQQNAGIPLSHAPSGVGYKLFELPPELVSLLEGDNPPTLSLTSSPTAALLKTPDKTYSLLQKNTSNALILLAPAEVAPATSEPSAEDEPSALQIPIPGLSAFATVHETIELVAETEGASAPAVKAKGKWHEKFGRNR
ncbi:hypothetical protein GQ53DRAFT_741163 [Thozetella sp. PMI_491]|nr:hypothetical protein GQ53DRAFT_741163 [Thozetella sp. PMI_491]